jgi:hypothetical protein
MTDTTYFNLEDRYRRDAVFKTIVDQMMALITHYKIAPYEIRDAAAFASILFARRTIEPIFIHSRFPDMFRSTGEANDTDD